ncbi:MAG TPA: tetratricopeptide repeat protein [Vicinamibacterales bacterium]|nr:tetratricopeptide repeat protein [Vicinamibacterales bacterium]
MWKASVLVVGAVLVVSACTPKKIPAPIVTSPQFPEFVAPVVPVAYAGTAAAAGEERGWRFLQTGDLKNAERELSATLKATPAFFPAEAALGYVELARKDAKAALGHFDRALAQQAAYAPALTGRGQALLALNRNADAVASFEAAIAADPSLTDLRRRVEVLKFRALEQSLAAARDAARAGKPDEAIRAYTAALASSPDSPFLYRELAAVEQKKGDAGAALAYFQKAVALDPTDAHSFEQIGDILESEGDDEAAAKAYESANAIEPTAARAEKIDAVHDKIARARLPAEFHAIDQAPQITRADLAALIGVHLQPLLQARQRDAVLITDVRTNWASSWIMAVARAGVMEPFSNHAFQPRMIVRRADLAQAVARLLARIAAANPGQPNAWDSARGTFSDVAPGHLAYRAASAAVAAHVMSVGPDNAFQPSRPVTGAEALDAVAKLEALAHLPDSRGGSRP